VERAITGYHRDVEGDWVADLSCGHGQHVRHRPPFQLRAWVLEAEGRRAKLGTLLACPLCDRAELPDGLRLVRSSPEWDEQSMPVGLRRAHRIAGGTWGRVVVRHGKLRFVAATEPELDVVLGPGSTQAIPPDVVHDVHPLGQVRFSIDFLSIPSATNASMSDHEVSVQRAGMSTARDLDEGGEAACLAHLLCPECGVVLGTGVDPLR
jgi:tellurite resistance-related uncharacterized protein